MLARTSPKVLEQGPSFAVGGFFVPGGHAGTLCQIERGALGVGICGVFQTCVRVVRIRHRVDLPHRSGRGMFAEAALDHDVVMALACGIRHIRHYARRVRAVLFASVQPASGEADYDDL